LDNLGEVFSAKIAFSLGEDVWNMKMLAAVVLIVGGALLLTPAYAGSLGSGAPLMKSEFEASNVQYTRGGSRAFRRCMRAKYGPRYFSRVPRAHRFHMAQACGG
jgi:hypothetical protein